MLTVFNPINRLEGKVLFSYCDFKTVNNFNKLYNINRYEYQFDGIIDDIYTLVLKNEFHNYIRTYLSGGLARLMIYTIIKYNIDIDDDYIGNILKRISKIDFDADIYIEYDDYIDNILIFNNIINNGNLRIIDKGNMYSLNSEDKNICTSIPWIHKVYTIENLYFGHVDIIIIESGYKIKYVVNNFDFDICSNYIGNDIVYIKNLNDLVENKCVNFNDYTFDIWFDNQLNFIGIKNNQLEIDNYNGMTNLLKECLNYHNNIIFPYHEHIYFNIFGKNVILHKDLFGNIVEYMLLSSNINPNNFNYQIDYSIYNYSNIELNLLSSDIYYIPYIEFYEKKTYVIINIKQNIYELFDKIFDDNRMNIIINNLPINNVVNFINDMELEFINYLINNDKILTDTYSLPLDKYNYIKYFDCNINLFSIINEYDIIKLTGDNKIKYENYTSIYIDDKRDKKNANNIGSILTLRKIFYLTKICDYYKKITILIDKEIKRFIKYDTKYNCDLHKCFENMWEPYFNYKSQKLDKSKNNYKYDVYMIHNYKTNTNTTTIINN